MVRACQGRSKTSSHDGVARVRFPGHGPNFFLDKKLEETIINGKLHEAQERRLGSSI